MKGANMIIRRFVPTMLTLASILLIVSEVRADSFGTVVGSFNGVTTYSNGTNSYFSNKPNAVNGYTTGYKWQCVEYATRYYKVIYNMQIRGGDANTWYGNASSKGLRKFANGGTTKPAVGDILCSGYSTGHVAIIREVGSNYVKVIHQNWANSSADNSKTLSMTVSSGKYTIAAAGSYSWQGWLRK